ncbi:type II secretion system protein M [Pseudoalteromonas sp. MMG010]|uniref:type II secretion system protein GspM n=1 Tax=Pseudoalteromonas sp. MMG010 TaxID=2822685 RepID=UPI001B3A331D|nr:type II secretion system protein GspM [Pseudoalteromonas sp. MMG010]MBQ4832648.1 type II secretion system protein M [Pseudoalteromonas sp. MMG010]
MSDSNKRHRLSWWGTAKVKFSRLHKREKYASLFVGFFVVLYLGWVFVISPTKLNAQRKEALATVKQQELKQVEQQISMLKQALNVDYTKKLRDEISTTKQSLKQINEKISQFSQSFTAAKQVPVVLKDLLLSTPNVQVVAFEVMPAKAIDVEKLGEHDAQTLFFEHQMLVTLEGSYFDLQQYLASLQHRQKKLLIRAFNYQVTQYPNAKLTLQIATVGANETFIIL